MRHFLAIFALFMAVGLQQPANAQFDFGNIIRGESQQLMRELERNVVDQIRNEVGGGFRNPPRHEVLPYPPINRPPVCQNPPVITYPIHGQPITQPKPAPKPEPKLPQVKVGSPVSIDGKGFGNDPGAVFVKIDRLVLTAELTQWNDKLAEAKLPSIPLAEPAKATVFVMTAKEEIAHQIEVTLVPAPEEENESESAESLPVVHSGQEIDLEGELGEKQGHVELIIGTLKLRAKILNWSATEISLKLPTLETPEPLQATLAIYKHDGKLAENLDVQFTNQPE